MVRQVPPGAYELTVRHTPNPAVPAIVELARTRVDVVAGDVEGVVLATRAGESVTGQVVYDDGISEGRTPRVTVASTVTRTNMPAPVVEVADQTFSVRNIFDPVVIRGSVSAPRTANWSLKAVLLDGRDVTDVPTVFTAAHSGRLQVVFTTRAATVEGTVTGDGGAPADDCAIVLFIDDPARWTPLSTAIRVTSPAGGGRFTFRGVPEGQYRVVAASGDLQLSPGAPDEALLERLRKVSTPVVVSGAETRTIDLRVVSFDQ
jgi:hypothetical protein